MSEDEDDAPEALFFTKRAAFIPKVSAEQFQSVSKQLSETSENVIKFLEKEKLPSTAKKAKTRNAVRKLVPEPEEISEEDSRGPTPPSPQPTLSAAVKKRLKKHQLERASEMRLIEAANRQVMKDASKTSFSEVEDVLDTSCDSYVNVILTLSYMSEVSRLRCSEHEKFSTIFPKVADLFNLKASELLLCLRDKNIKVDDTPKSLNITLNDIIECIPYKESDHAKEDDDVDKIKLIFQSNDSKEKIDLFVHKLEKMQEVMEKYSKRRGIPLNKLVFVFDGERIEGTETPEELDMETGNCIDVKVVTESHVNIVTSSPVKVVTASPVQVVTISVPDSPVPQTRIPKARRGRKRRGARNSRGGRGRGRKQTADPVTVVTVGEDSDDSDELAS